MCTALEEEKYDKNIQEREEGKFVLMLVVLFPTIQLVLLGFFCCCFLIIILTGNKWGAFFPQVKSNLICL